MTKLVNAIDNHPIVRLFVLLSCYWKLHYPHLPFHLLIYPSGRAKKEILILNYCVHREHAPPAPRLRWARISAPSLTDPFQFLR